MRLEPIDDGRDFDAYMNMLDVEAEERREIEIMHALNEAIARQADEDLQEQRLAEELRTDAETSYRESTL